jgi:hypothetical protein
MPALKISWCRNSELPEKSVVNRQNRHAVTHAWGPDPGGHRLLSKSMLACGNSRCGDGQPLRSRLCTRLGGADLGSGLGRRRPTPAGSGDLGLGLWAERSMHIPFCATTVPGPPHLSIGFLAPFLACASGGVFARVSGLALRALRSRSHPSSFSGLLLTKRATRYSRFGPFPGTAIRCRYRRRPASRLQQRRRSGAPKFHHC